ncbi:Cartilage oligomeric matrix protein, partial [Takifugu flavidus]
YQKDADVYSFSCFCFSDGEIISQIKMTNIALAEIKELLKQQLKEVGFLKNAMMECEACGELFFYYHRPVDSP